MTDKGEVSFRSIYTEKHGEELLTGVQTINNCDGKRQQGSVQFEVLRVPSSGSGHDGVEFRLVHQEKWR